MANKNRNQRNQPPTGQGKKQRPYSGSAKKLRKRSEVLQAQRYQSARQMCSGLVLCG